MNPENNINNENQTIESNITQQSQVVPSQSNSESLSPVSFDAFGNPITASQQTEPKDNKKLYMIIGIVVALIIIIALIVISNNGDKDSSSSSSSSNGSNYEPSKETEIKNYLYLYKNDANEYFIRNYEITGSEAKDYTLIKKHTCVTECKGVVYNLDNELKFYYVDNGMLHVYNKESDSTDLVNLGKVVEGNKVKFTYDDNLIIGYTDNNIDVSRNSISIYTSTSEKISGQTVQYMKIINADRDSLSEGFYLEKDDYTEYKVFKIYQRENKIAEVKDTELDTVMNFKLSQNFVQVSTTKKDLIISKDGKTQIIVDEKDYEIIDNNIIVNKDGKISLYDYQGIIRSYEAPQRTIIEKGYVAYIKDKTLTIKNILTDEVFYEFKNIPDNLVMIDNTVSRIGTYSTYSDSITIFLMDNTIEKEGNYVKGVEYYYSKYYDKEEIKADQSKYVSSTE